MATNEEDHPLEGINKKLLHNLETTYMANPGAEDDAYAKGYQLFRNDIKNNKSASELAFMAREIIRHQRAVISDPGFEEFVYMDGYLLLEGGIKLKYPTSRRLAVAPFRDGHSFKERESAHFTGRDLATYNPRTRTYLHYGHLPTFKVTPTEYQVRFDRIDIESAFGAKLSFKPFQSLPAGAVLTFEPGSESSTQFVVYHYDREVFNKRKIESALVIPPWWTKDGPVANPPVVVTQAARTNQAMKLRLKELEQTSVSPAAIKPVPKVRVAVAGSNDPSIRNIILDAAPTRQMTLAELAATRAYQDKMKSLARNEEKKLVLATELNIRGPKRLEVSGIPRSFLGKTLRSDTPHDIRVKHAKVTARLKEAFMHEHSKLSRADRDFIESLQPYLE